MLKCLDQRVREAVEGVAAFQDGLPLHAVQDFANFSARHVLMVEKRYEVGNRLLEIAVVSPERVVGVNEQGVRLGKPLSRAGSARELRLRNVGGHVGSRS